MDGGDVIPMFLDEDELTDVDQFLENYKTRMVSNPVGNVAHPPAAAMSIRTTKRIQAQLGVFTIHHADPAPLESWGGRNFLWRFIVPQEAKLGILKELRLIGISMLSLFPELDNVAAAARTD